MMFYVNYLNFMNITIIAISRDERVAFSLQACLKVTTHKNLGIRLFQSDPEPGFNIWPDPGPV